MPRMGEKELFSSLKQGTLAPVYFFYGKDSYFTRAAVQKIVSRMKKENANGFGRQHFSGDETSVSELEDVCEQYPLFGQSKCVTVCDMDVDKLNKEDFDRLLSLVSQPNESTTLLYYLIDKQADMKKSAKYRKFAEAVIKSGVVCEFIKKDRTTLKRALCEKAKKSYLSMDMYAADLLVERCLGDYQLLNNEMDKLICHAENGEITKKDVEECCASSIEASAFTLAKDILSCRYDRAFAELGDLFALRQDAVSILGALSMAFFDIYRAKCAVAAHRSPEETARDFNYPKNRMFAVNNAFQDVSHFSARHIRTCILLLSDADRALKSSRSDERSILEEMMGKMVLSASQDSRR